MIIESNNIPSQMGGTLVVLLCALREAEEDGTQLSLTDLSKRLGISTAAMTGAQDAAVKRGWVTARHDAADRRQKRLELTREGLALVESMRPAAADAACGGLSAVGGGPLAEWKGEAAA